MIEIPKNFIGLDVETTGTDPKLHRIIQLGLALPGKDAIAWDVWQDKATVTRAEPEAMAVNNFTPERIAGGLSAANVDRMAVEYIGNVEGRIYNAVGWNVASFDLQFIKNEFPELNRRLHYRTIDLNALVFALSIVTADPYNSIKRRAQDYALERLNAAGVVVQWHDAGYDAVASLFALQYLLSRMSLERVAQASFFTPAALAATR
jgi:DNA polymerase III epsilon subunit-like protein